MPMLQLLFFLLLSFPTGLCQQAILGQSNLRNATIDDLDDVVDIFFAAFSPSAQYKYVFQFQDEFPEEHRKCQRANFKKAFELSNYFVQVVTMPTNDNPIKPVAVAVWKYPTSHGKLVSSLIEGDCTFRDANMTRAIDFEKKFANATDKYLHNFGPNQLYLSVLGTHPDYQGLGAGSQLVLSGIEVARQLLSNVTLIATDVGEPVYSHLGFQSIKNVTIQSIDNDMEFLYDIMYYDIDSNQ